MEQQKGNMLRRFWKEEPSVLDEPIGKVLTEMNTYDPETEEFRHAMEYLERLIKLKAEERPQRVSRDTMWIVGGNLIGILIIVAYEQKHAMVSKGMGLLLKTKS
jgi:hypothetical protein